MDSHIFRKEICIDYAHRVKGHKTTCSFLHGHRGKIEAWVRAEILESGSRTGLDIDFDFICEILAERVAAPCDHGLILSVDDPLVRTLRPTWSDEDMMRIALATDTHGQMITEALCGKLYLIPDAPNCQNLARHFFERLRQPILSRSGGRAKLVGLRFWETPGSWASYGPEFGSQSAILEWDQL